MNYSNTKEMKVKRKSNSACAKIHDNDDNIDGLKCKTVLADLNRKKGKL